ncbi:MAG: type VI secretion system Vgr family protein, partial [Bryobacteraceae bacterium]
HNEFEAIPNSVDYRPPRLARKPLIEGSQTAVVVGKAGEEIWTDKYGRVTVQFPWDREGKLDENSSCWIRVSHQWAGKQWGAIYTPRIGQEVIVGFLEGDPDQPIITGRVYNADLTVPYALPGEQTKSTLKSMSSKGGGGFNEFRFEDKKGEEQVFIHGEKDLDVRIKNDRKEWIGKDRHRIVKGDEFEKTGGDKHIQLTGDKNEKVDGTVSLKAGMDMQQKVGMNYALDAGMEVHVKSGMNLVIETGATLTLKVGGNFININPGGVFIKGTMVMINSGGSAGTGAGASPQAPKDPTEADKADPGQMGQMTARQVHTPSTLNLATISPAAAVLRSAAHSGAPFCDT